MLSPTRKVFVLRKDRRTQETGNSPPWRLTSAIHSDSPVVDARADDKDRAVHVFRGSFCVRDCGGYHEPICGRHFLSLRLLRVESAKAEEDLHHHISGWPGVTVAESTTDISSRTRSFGSFLLYRRGRLYTIPARSQVLGPQEIKGLALGPPQVVLGSLTLFCRESLKLLLQLQHLFSTQTEQIQDTHQASLIDRGGGFFLHSRLGVKRDA